MARCGRRAGRGGRGPGPANAADGPPAKLAVDLTTPPVVDPQDLGSFALSPDGTRVVATGVVDGRSQLVVRGLNSGTATAVPGTAGAYFPFWAPDGRSLGFFLDGELRRLDLDAGLIRPLVKATVGVGGSWNGEGTILFAPTPASPIMRTSSDGGTPVAVTAFARRTRRTRIPAIPARWPPLPLLRRRQPGRPRRVRRSARRIGDERGCSMPTRRPSTRRGICSSSATAPSSPSRSIPGNSP